jgi:hypothetical protein
MTFLKGYRTILFNTLVMLAGLAEYVDLINVIAPEYTPVVLLVVGIANILIRFITTTPVATNN